MTEATSSRRRHKAFPAVNQRKVRGVWNNWSCNEKQRNGQENAALGVVEGMVSGALAPASTSAPLACAYGA